MDRFKSTDKAANLILITYDQWRGDWGNAIKPTIDLKSFKRLAKEGWTAEHCYTSSPQCVPARLSWITGLEPSKIGITKNQPANISRNAPSIIRGLRKKGWTTGIVGKTHWSNHNEETNLKKNKKRIRGLGFQRVVEIAGPRALQKVKCAITKDWQQEGVYNDQLEDLKRRYQNGRSKEAWEVRETILPNKLYPDIWVANQGLKMLDKMPEDKPWLLWISFVGPHEPFDTPYPWKNTSNNIELPDRYENNGWIDRLTNENSLKRVKDLWLNKLNNQDIEDLRRDYADHLKLLDDQTNKILNALEKRKDNNRTAVLLTADHGEMLGDHEILYKSTFLEGSVRVPFIYKPPSRENLKAYGSESKPLGLTELIKKIVTSIEKGEKFDSLLRWCKKQKGAIVEFEDETMFVRGRNKVVYNKNKKILWWTNIREDFGESVNKAEYLSDSEIKEKLNKLTTWAEKELKRRDGNDWHDPNVLENK